jgi:hypothetical protein
MKTTLLLILLSLTQNQERLLRHLDLYNDSGCDTVIFTRYHNRWTIFQEEIFGENWIDSFDNKIKSIDTNIYEHNRLIKNTSKSFGYYPGRFDSESIVSTNKYFLNDDKLTI